MQTAQLLKYSTLSQYQRGISISSSDRSNIKSDATSLRCYQPLFFEMLSTPIFEMLSTPIFWDAINPYFASSSNSQKKYQTCLHNVDNKLYSNSFLLTTKLFNKNNKKIQQTFTKATFSNFLQMSTQQNDSCFDDFFLKLIEPYLEHRNNLLCLTFQELQKMLFVH